MDFYELKITKQSFITRKGLLFSYQQENSYFDSETQIYWKQRQEVFQFLRNNSGCPIQNLNNAAESLMLTIDSMNFNVLIVRIKIKNDLLKTTTNETMQYVEKDQMGEECEKLLEYTAGMCISSLN